jgi:hypothetical protein
MVKATVSWRPGFLCVERFFGADAAPVVQLK